MPTGAANDAANQASLHLARQSPGFVTVKEMIAEAVSQRTDGIQLESSAVQVVVQHRIDGFLQPNLTPRDKTLASHAGPRLPVHFGRAEWQGSPHAVIRRLQGRV